MVETGSTGDTVIFEEFKGTGNAELKLDRKIAERRVFPAVDVNPSGTRKDELLLSPDEFAVVHKLRRVLSGLDSPSGHRPADEPAAQDQDQLRVPGPGLEDHARRHGHRLTVRTDVYSSHPARRKPPLSGSADLAVRSREPEVLTSIGRRGRHRRSRYCPASTMRPPASSTGRSAPSSAQYRHESALPLRSR